MSDQENTIQAPVNIEQETVAAQIEALNNAVNDLRKSDDELDERLTRAIENMVEILKGLLDRVEKLEKNNT